MSSQYSFTLLQPLRHGKLWTPAMGEFHYARYPRSQWQLEIEKLKACYHNAP